ncbi:hypothetical protein BD289DRAFT_370842 [Coniella lustricola]|uniref:Cora-like Mg2+ transporter protein-domain-containing protein n=1 Tax=Coniella lustricola TaxID=2025994 RepID=A0A2T3A4N0_9PEZI|nr:hypothetical protein BD289DRAFT_370842 [Coniella lustricola]
MTLSGLHSARLNEDGAWIAPDGDYQQLTRDLCGADPRLRQQDEKMSRYGVYWSSRPCRVLALEFQEKDLDGRAYPVVSHEFTDAESLGLFLNQRSCQDEQAVRGARPTAHHNRVYIVEGANRSFIGVLGPHFGIPPSLIMDYERITTVAVAPDRGQSSLLYSNWGTRGYFVLSYQELFSLPLAARDKARARCPDTARIIRGTRQNGKYAETGMIHRRCGFWSDIRATQNGWDSIIFCDPPLRKIIILDDGPMKGHEVLALPHPPGDGYIDFFPPEIQLACRAGPPRTSIADDMCFYLTKYHEFVGVRDPDSASLFLKKIIASHYTKHFDFLRKNIMENLRGMGRQSHFAYSDLSSIEASWSDTQTLERRLGHFFLDLEEILVQLRIPLETPDPRKVTSWQDTEADFQFLYYRYKWIRESVDRVNSSITGLTSIAGNRQALRSAERSTHITFIGLLFIPLAFIASLFSMADPYGPGKDKFWLYFATGIPVTILVMMVYYIFDILLNWYEAAIKPAER